METSIATTLSNALDAYSTKKNPRGTEESSRGGGLNESKGKQLREEW